MDLLKKIEPFVSFVGEIDKSETVGLIFGLVLFIFVFSAWYWICFRNGAVVWSNSIKNYYNKIGLSKLGELSFFNPMALKIFATIFLCVLIFAGFLIGGKFI